MSIYINSDDYDSGSTSDGTWSINRTLNGQYNVINQQMEPQTIPWTWTGLVTLVFKTSGVGAPVNPYTIQVHLPTSIGLLSSLSAIATQIQTSIQSAFDTAEGVYAGYGRDVTVASDSILKTITLTFSDVVSLQWTSAFSTFNQSAGIPIPSGSPTDLTDVTSIVLSSKYMSINPKYLEVFIEESSSQYTTSHSSVPTLLFSTKDSEFTDQSFYIRGNVNQLNISIYRINIHTSPVPLSGSWNLILEP